MCKNCCVSQVNFGSFGAGAQQLRWLDNAIGARYDSLLNVSRYRNTSRPTFHAIQPTTEQYF